MIMKKIISCIALFALLNACKKESLKSSELLKPEPSEIQTIQDDDLSEDISNKPPGGNSQSVTKLPTIATNIFPTQSNANVWIDPVGALSVGGSAATSSLSRNGICNSNMQCYKSAELQVTGFGFNIPTDATIENIKVQVKSKASLSNSIKDLTVQLANWDNVVGTPVNRANNTFWDAKYSVKTYTGPMSSWGLVSYPIWWDQIAFGLRISCNNLNTSSSAPGIH